MTELFWLDYQADSGTITSFLVHKVNTFLLFDINVMCFDLLKFLFVLNLLVLLFLKEDKPEKIVECVAEKNILDSAMRAALEARIQKEMDKRRDKS